MSLGHNERLRQFLDLLERGEVHRARQGCANQEEWAARLGMSIGTFRGVQRRARELGHAVPNWTGLVTVDQEFDFSDEEKTQPRGDVSEPIEGAQHDSIVPLPAIGEGFRVRAKSTLVRPDGSIAGQWIKTAANQNDADAWLRAARGLADEMPRLEPVAIPTSELDDDLLNVFMMGDPHFGMIARNADGVLTFNTEIAERLMFDATDRLITRAACARRALFIDIGDGLHADTIAGTTTKGTKVDADLWWHAMRVKLRTNRRQIDRALQTHEYVHFIIERGNHDLQSSIASAMVLAAAYENEPRVTIDVSPKSHHFYRFGECLIMTNHGERQKAADLALYLAANMPREWGETRHRYIVTGHVHHDTSKEVPGAIVETLRTLASADDWHERSGYGAGRDMKCDLIHRTRGRIRRDIVGIEELESAA